MELNYFFLSLFFGLKFCVVCCRIWYGYGVGLFFIFLIFVNDIYEFMLEEGEFIEICEVCNLYFLKILII